MVISDRQRKELGRAAELFVAQHLESKGFRILRRNFFVRGGEIDIIAGKEDTILFVEVRAWDHPYWDKASPVVTVHRSKMQRIVKAARYFMLTNNIDENRVFIRFDVAGVIRTTDGFSLDYYENAFDSGGNV